MSYNKELDDLVAKGISGGKLEMLSKLVADAKTDWGMQDVLEWIRVQMETIDPDPLDEELNKPRKRQCAHYITQDVGHQRICLGCKVVLVDLKAEQQFQQEEGR